MIPKYTIRITNTGLGKYIEIGADDFSEFKKKTISGKSAIYALLDRAEEEIGKASSNSPK